MKKAFPLLVLLAAAGCNPTSDSDATTESAAPPAGADSPLKAVSAYIQAHAAAYPGYEPVRWGRPTAYTKASEAAVKGIVAMQDFDDALGPRNQALANYQAALARHEAPALVAALKARYVKANKHNDSLLAAANRFIGVKDSTRLGTQIVHAYRTLNRAGTQALDSVTFVVYSSGRVEQL